MIYKEYKKRQKLHKFRPKRIEIEYRCSYTDKYLGGFEGGYDPLRMLSGWYRKTTIKVKAAIENDLRRDGDLIGKFVTRVKFLY